MLSIRQRKSIGLECKKRYLKLSLINALQEHKMGKKPTAAKSEVIKTMYSFLSIWIAINFRCWIICTVHGGKNETESLSETDFTLPSTYDPLNCFATRSDHSHPLTSNVTLTICPQWSSVYKKITINTHRASTAASSIGAIPFVTIKGFQRLFFLSDALS